MFFCFQSKYRVFAFYLFWFGRYFNILLISLFIFDYCILFIFSYICSYKDLWNIFSDL